MISNSLYVVNILKHLEITGQINLKSTIGDLLVQLQAMIWQRDHPFFVQHIRAHIRPLAEGNDLADRASRSIFAFFNSTPFDCAQKFHSNFHVNSKTLMAKFKITRAEARDIVKSCTSCAPLLPQASLGVNPRGLHPLHVWQMDVTHIPEFGRLRFVHVSIDTASGVIFASLHSGEATKHVIAHCLEAWSAWGMPSSLKTDNGPAYTSSSFVAFCQVMGISLVHGLPYNPQGQGIIERAHRTFKECLLKQKGGIGQGRTPKERVSLALLTLNFFQLDIQGHSTAERHAYPDTTEKGQVMWKDILTGKWHGPDPVLIWARGSVCVFPQDQDKPLWIPERLTWVIATRPISQHKEDEAMDTVGGTAPTDASCLTF